MAFKTWWGHQYIDGGYNLPHPVGIGLRWLPNMSPCPQARLFFMLNNLIYHDFRTITGFYSCVLPKQKVRFKLSRNGFFFVNPIPTTLCHLIYCCGDKIYPCLVGIGLKHNANVLCFSGLTNFCYQNWTNAFYERKKMRWRRILRDKN